MNEDIPSLIIRMTIGDGMALSFPNDDYDDADAKTLHFETSFPPIFYDLFMMSPLLDMPGFETVT